MNRKVIWQKWIDPFLTNLDEVEPINGIDEAKLDGKEDFDTTYQDSYQQAEEKIAAVNKAEKPINTGPIMAGPMGLIPLTEYNIPSKIYCFWMGHTNFDIGKKEEKILEEIPGVEALDIFSRYRFRIAVGKAFLSEEDPFGREVLKAITAALCPNKDNKQEKGEDKDSKDKNLTVIKNHLKTKYEHWAIFALPDGQIETKGFDSKEELQKEVEHRPALATS